MLKPIFYTDSVNWLKINGRAKSDLLTSRAGSFNTGYDVYDAFDLNPMNVASWDTSGNTTTHIVIEIDLGYTGTSIDSISILNHNLVTAEGDIRVAHSSSPIASAGGGTAISGASEVLNAGVDIPVAEEIITPTADGDSVFTFTPSSDRYWAIEIQDISNFSATDLTIGAIMIGESYSLPYSPDLNVSHAFDIGGVNVSSSIGGKRYSSPNWIKANNDSAVGTNYIPFRSGTGAEQIPGRESFSISYSTIEDTDLLPSNLASPDTDTFIHKVFTKTAWNTLPMVWSVDSTSTTSGDYMFGRLVGNSFSMTQTAYRVYSTAFSIEQEF